VKRITITVDREGKAVTEASGFAGTECRDATAPILEALGDATREDLKPEYYEPRRNENEVHG
jgi:hypothetical protein